MITPLTEAMGVTARRVLRAKKTRGAEKRLRPYEVTPPHAFSACAAERSRKPA